MGTNVGERIKLIRQQWGLTQEVVAKRAGISRIALGNYERGERTPPIDIFARIANALHVSMDDLYGFNKPTKWEWIKKELNTHGFFVKHSKVHEGYIIVLEKTHSIDYFSPLKDAPIEIQETFKECLEDEEKKRREYSSRERPHLSIWETRFIGRWFYIADEETLYNLLKKVTDSYAFSEILSRLYLNTLTFYSTQQLAKVQKSDLNSDDLWKKILPVKV